MAATSSESHPGSPPSLCRLRAPLSQPPLHRNHTGCSQADDNHFDFISENFLKIFASAPWEATRWFTTRYGHAAALVVWNSEKDRDSVRRQFMYIFGGIAQRCSDTLGICDDLWRYEIGWAPMAYYARFPNRDWNRGNQWFKMRSPRKLCPFGTLGVFSRGNDHAAVAEAVSSPAAIRAFLHEPLQLQKLCRIPTRPRR